MATQLKEVVINPNAFEGKQVSKNLRKDVLLGRSRSSLGFRWTHWCGKGAAVDFAAGSHRQAVELNKGRGNHVGGQLPLQEGSPVSWRALLSEHDVGHQLALSGFVLSSQHDGRGDVGVTTEHHLDLPRFDPKTADLELIIRSPEKLDVAIWQIPDNVALFGRVVGHPCCRKDRARTSRR